MKPKILFVDDDAFIRKIYIDRLEASGFSVTAVSNVTDARNTLTQASIDSPFNLVCLDQMLGDQTGMDVLTWIRKEFKSDIPVLIFSASGQEKNIQEFMAAGASEYIQKDHIVPAQLVEKINGYLKK